MSNADLKLLLEASAALYDMQQANNTITIEQCDRTRDRLHDRIQELERCEADSRASTEQLARRLWPEDYKTVDTDPAP